MDIKLLLQQDLKSLSIIIPTFNSSSTIGKCLNSIFEQDYPLDNIEVIIVDGGSKDSTLEIAALYPVKVVHNPLRTGEAGKYLGLKKSRGKLVAFIDSDNVLPSKEWIKKMIAPLNREDIVGSEPYTFTYDKDLPLISRYVALFGVCDPLQLYLGNRERWNWLHQDIIQDPKHRVIEKKDFYLLELDKENVPTLGANGFIARREQLLENSTSPYYFDIDVIHVLVHKGFNIFAMPKVGIVHIFSTNIRQFLRKNYRRIHEYLYFTRNRTYKWFQRKSIKEAIKFILWSFTLFLPVRDSVNGYRMKPDIAWFFHPVACILVSFVYSITYFLQKVIPEKLSILFFKKTNPWKVIT